MNEAQRSLRYVLPGLSTILILLLTFLYSDYTTTMDFLKKVMGGSGIEATIVVLLGSGALGYLLANIYFAIVWLPKIRKWASYDHCTVINDLVRRQLLQVEGYDGVLTKVRNQREAWEMINSFTCYHKVAPFYDRYSAIKGSLVNATHALGATIVGLILVILFWCISFYGILPYQWHETWLIGVGVPMSVSLLIVLLGRTYRQALLSSERIANSVFKEYIVRESNRWKPISLTFHK